jgi:hypothetical protein
MASSKTPKAPEAAPAAAEAGLTVFDNTEASTREAPASTVAEEYELTEGLVQVNYV